MPWDPQIWLEMITSALTEMLNRVAAFLPNLVGALLVLLVGWLLAWLAQRIARRVLARLGFDHLAERAGVTEVLTRTGVTTPASHLLGRVIYWLLLLIRGTRAVQIILGLAILLAVSLASQLFQFITLSWIPGNFLGYAVIIIIVLFQPDICRALARVGGGFFRSFSRYEESQLLEEIVGGLPRPDEETEARVTQCDDGSWWLDGLLPIDEFKELLHIPELPGETQGLYETLGGFVMWSMGRIPAPGDHFNCDTVRFEVTDMDGLRVDKVLVEHYGDENSVRDAA